MRNRVYLGEKCKNCIEKLKCKKWIIFGSEKIIYGFFWLISRMKKVYQKKTMEKHLDISWNLVLKIRINMKINVKNILNYLKLKCKKHLKYS